jgi:hypothetical protein
MHFHNSKNNNAQITLVTLYVYRRKRPSIVKQSCKITLNVSDGGCTFHSISHGRNNMQITNLSCEEDQLTVTARKEYINL